MAFYTLGIETSCDETAASVVADGRKILSNIVFSQAQLHSKYGGVVPEIASRNHLKKIPFVLEEALEQAGIALEKIDLVGATYGPGLVGCLLVGLSMAKGIAYARDIPFVGINHLEGHIFAHYIESPDAPPPFLALIVSGGHTNLVYVKQYGQYEPLGETQDDAAGEGFDKVGKLIGLDYPAGPKIDKLSKLGDSKLIQLPRPMLQEEGYNFSFAGLKTAIVYYLKEHQGTKREDIAASFQSAVVDVLLKKTLQAAKKKGVDRIVVVGGVAANSLLRQRFKEEAEKIRKEVHFPSLLLCTDNAAMIAANAYFKYKELGQQDDLSLAPQPSLRI